MHRNADPNDRSPALLTLPPPSITATFTDDIKLLTLGSGSTYFGLIQLPLSGAHFLGPLPVHFGPVQST